MFEKETRVAVRAALDAGAYLMRSFHKHRSVRFKGDRSNLVTEVDVASEDRIRRHLKRFFPSDDFIGEEKTKEFSGARRRWHVDPLDGTVNFVHGLPIFCTSIALEVSGRVQVGAVFCPTLRELYVARRGRGATCNGKPIHVSQTSGSRQAFLVTGFPYTPTGRAANMVFFDRFIRATQAVRRIGSAAMDLCWVAAGIYDGFWEFALGAWDIAAGQLIVTEAGGLVTDFRGGPCDLNRGEIVASNGRIHRRMLTILNLKESR